MLTVTENAASVIRDLLACADLPEGAGLRLAQRDEHTCLAMALTTKPGPDDLIVPSESVFLGPVAAQRTDGQVLDATETAFFLRDRLG